MSMKRLLKTASAAAVGGAFALVAGLSAPTEANSPIRSVAWDFDFWGTFEEASTTSTAPGSPVGPPVLPDPTKSTFAADGDGLIIYEKTFQVRGANTLRVTLSTTGDTHNGAASWFACIVTDPDGTRRFCNPGGPGASANPPGWITLLKEPQPVMSTNCNDGAGGSADCHDNGIHYAWCTQIPKSAGVYTVELWMASSAVGSRVFIEQAHFYVDQTKIVQENVCVDPTG